MTWSQLGTWRAEPLAPAADAALNLAKRVSNAGEELHVGGHPKAWKGAASDAAGQRLTHLIATSEPQVSASRMVGSHLDSTAAELRRIVAQRETIAEYAESWQLRIGDEITYAGPPIPARNQPQLDSVQEAINETAAAVREILEDAAHLDTRLTTALTQSQVPYKHIFDELQHDDSVGVEAPAHPSAPSGLSGWSPEKVSKWWKGLSSSDRVSLVQSEPSLIGNLNGVPAKYRDKANRIQLKIDTANIVAEFKRRGMKVPQSSKEIDIGNFDIGYDEQAKALRNFLSKAQNVLATNEALKHRSNSPVLYSYDPTAFYDTRRGFEGRIAVALGDIDHAKNVSVNVPGFTTNMGHSTPGKVDDIDRLYTTAKRRAQGGYATMYWLGYAAPQLADVATDENAQAGAPSLQSDLHALRVLNPGSNLGLVGHSYGSLVSGVALKSGASKDVDYAVVVGSPGMDVARKQELGLGEKPLYVGSASNDPVTSLLHPFGTDPALENFGGVRFKAESPDRGETGFTGDHSKYYNYMPGGNSQVPTESLRALALITSGHGDDLSRFSLRTKGRQDHWYDPWGYVVTDPEEEREPGH